MPDPAPEKASEVIAAQAVTKTYRDGDRRLEVLRGVDFRLAAGEFVAIVGQSGSGKSTLLHLLGGLDRPTTGTVRISGQDASKLDDRRLAELRGRKVGFIYQFHHLLPEFSALENVFIPAMILRSDSSALAPRAESLLTSVGLGERLHHRPAKLSGGEQQRVALARALMNDPQVVLADEPTGDLDQQTGREIMDFVVERTISEGRSLVVVTHDPAIAARAHRILKIEKGRLLPDPALAGGAPASA